MDTIFTVWPTAQIYAAAGSQDHAPNSPHVPNSRNWLAKVWGNLDNQYRTKLTGFHIHLYPGYDKFSTTPTHNPYPKWSRESIEYRIQDYYNWFELRSITGKKIILSETGTPIEGAPDTSAVNLPLRIHRACRNKSVKRWFWYAYVPCETYQPLAVLQGSSYVLTPMGAQFAAITPLTT